MFLCDSCHTEGGCEEGWRETTSRGPCERCSFSVACYDCHSYDFRKLDGPGTGSENGPVEYPSHITPGEAIEDLRALLDETS